MGGWGDVDVVEFVRGSTGLLCCPSFFFNDGVVV